MIFLIIVAPATYGFSTLQIENITLWVQHTTFLFIIGFIVLFIIIIGFIAVTILNNDIRDRDVEN